MKKETNTPAAADAVLNGKRETPHIEPQPKEAPQDDQKPDDAPNAPETNQDKPQATPKPKYGWCLLARKTTE